MVNRWPLVCACLLVTGWTVVHATHGTMKVEKGDDVAGLPGAKIFNYLASRGYKGTLASNPAPVKAVYIDSRAVNWNAPQQTLLDVTNGGFNVAILAFWHFSGGALDYAKAFSTVSPALRNATIGYLHAMGTIVMVSAGGSWELPYTLNATEYGIAVATWALQNDLDGVDFDLEQINQNFTCAPRSPCDGMPADTLISWIVNATAAARTVLGPERFVTHAPQAPYFGPIGVVPPNGNPFTGPTGGYTSVYKDPTPNNTIDWYNVQTYGQDPGCYVTYDSLFVASNYGGGCEDYPGTSISEIAHYGVPQTKLVVTKTLYSNDSGTGWVSADDLHAMVWMAKINLQWNTGVSVWEWDEGTAPAWLTTVYPPEL